MSNTGTDMPRWDVHFNMTVQVGDTTLIADLARAHALSSVIQGIPIPPHIQERLDRLNIVRAVRGTTGIEGTEFSEETVASILETPKREQDLSARQVREEQEVRNAAALMGFVAEYVERNPSAPLSEDLIKHFHEILTQGIKYEFNELGRYRTLSVQAGDYAPPAADDVPGLMAEFLRWFYSGPPRSWDPIIRAVIAHFYVVSIHPFGDGNGRTSRAVESYLLYQAGVNARSYYSLANYYYRERSQYVHMLDHVRFRSDPDLTPFVAFALRGLLEELGEVHREVLDEVRIISFRDYARETLAHTGKAATPTGERMLQFLVGLGNEAISLRDLRAGRLTLSTLYRRVTSKTLMRDINYLKQEGLVVVEGDALRASLEVMTQFTRVRPS